MIKRTFIHLLLLCTLISSQAWAWDNHDGLLDGETVSAAMPKVSDGDPGVDTQTVCDHYCCHAHAHLAGLFSAAIPINTPQAGALEPLCQNILISQNRDSLFKPPQA